MHTLKITGETPEALYFNVVKTLSMFLRGPAQPVEPIPSSDNGSSPQREHGGSTPSEGATLSASEIVVKAIKKGEDTKAAKLNKIAKATKAEVPNDPLPDSMSDGKIIEHDVSEVAGSSKELTLAGDIIPRLQAIQQACTKRGMLMPACVAFIQKLYAPFGIANAKQLKPESFAEFLEASEPYLKGEA